MDINKFIDVSVDVIDDLYVIESRSSVIKVVNDLKSLTWGKLKTKLRMSFNDMTKWLVKNKLDKEALDIINKSLGTRYSSIAQLNRAKMSESSINENWVSWWKEASSNIYGALTFYPLLTMFLEFDKLIKGSPDASLRVTLIYFLIWIGIISGKVLKDKVSQASRVGELKPNKA